ncbi:LPXTG cell wall anchor domain-containing protein [Pseudoclavibacter sp. CFCC 13796]|uniref:LPXTG cell wall anchor domain-containing protein n=1 Tax=Pseudoclavibacter sp. CFCC 13796 TaxID=2615179 RepID=UPI00178817F0|nr:LPXTG cell wall anchor domain-containing protein [Pseudoclavibacter sp. CFCC 13796]
MSKHAAPSTGSSFKKAKKAGIATAAGFALASAGIIGLNGVAQAEDLTDTTQSVNAPAASVVATDAQTEPLLSASTADKKPAAEVKKASTETTSKSVAAESPVENTTTPVQPATTLSEPVALTSTSESQVPQLREATPVAAEDSATLHTVSGTVTLPEGAVNKDVEVGATDENGYWLVSGTYDAAAGTFSIPGLQDGKYTIRAVVTSSNTAGGLGVSFVKVESQQTIAGSNVSGVSLVLPANGGMGGSIKLPDRFFEDYVSQGKGNSVFTVSVVNKDTGVELPQTIWNDLGFWSTELQGNFESTTPAGNYTVTLTATDPVSKVTKSTSHDVVLRPLDYVALDLSLDFSQDSNTDNKGSDNNGENDQKNTDAAGDEKPAADTDTNNNGSVKPVSSTSSDTTEQSSSTGKLAQTGASSAAIAAGMLLVGLGAGAVVVARRRQKAE